MQHTECRNLTQRHVARPMRLWLAVAVAMFFSSMSSAHASNYYVGGQMGLSLNSLSLNLGIEGGMRMGSWGFLSKADWNPWFNSQDFKGGVQPGVLNIGVGGEYLYFNERCRTAVFVGPSILLFNTALDDRGSVGFFVDIIAVSLRWPVSESIAIRVDPATMHLVVPVVTGIPLVSFQYRHTVGVEWLL